jgi:hypothetical protein
MAERPAAEEHTIGLFRPIDLRWSWSALDGDPSCESTAREAGDLRQGELRPGACQDGARLVAEAFSMSLSRSLSSRPRSPC